MGNGLLMVVEPFRREKKNPLDMLRAVDCLCLERVGGFCVDCRL